MAPLLLGDAHDDGQTPLDPDEIAGLRVPVTTRAALNAVEGDNIADAVAWLARRRRTPEVVISEEFLRELHRRMLGQVWRWAGEYRRTDTNLGVPWTEIPIGMRQILDDAPVWIASGMDPDQLAVLFGHRLVAVHPFPNGNGRHSRLASDCLAEALGRSPFSWGRGAGIVTASGTRTRYLAALRAGDDGDMGPLVSFARS